MTEKQLQLGLAGVLPDEADSSAHCDIQEVPPKECGILPPRRSVYVMDVHYLMYQVFHALPDIRSPTGEPVAALHGIFQDIIWIIDKREADYLFCAFDSPLSESLRRRRYPLYKANREDMPEQLQMQMPVLRLMLEAMGVPALACSGFEADDILATVSRSSEKQGMTCFLVSGDKDCRQLITESTKILNIRKDEVFDAASLANNWGIRPSQVVDFLILIGDAVDNIPGVPLIGPKTARQLLEQYDTLDNLFIHADEIPGVKRRARLMEARKSVFLTRQLIQLSDSVPIEVDWEAGRVCGKRPERILELCNQLGLHRLTERLALLSKILERRNQTAVVRAIH